MYDVRCVMCVVNCLLSVVCGVLFVVRCLLIEVCWLVFVVW